MNLIGGWLLYTISVAYITCSLPVARLSLQMRLVLRSQTLSLAERLWLCGAILLVYVIEWSAVVFGINSTSNVGLICRLSPMHVTERVNVQLR